MDIVMIKCPNCGGNTERRDGEYFSKCPYCGTEICFDEIKEEAQIGALKNRLNTLEENDREVQSVRDRLKLFYKFRNIYFAVISLLMIFGFTIITFADSDDPADETKLGLGSVSVLISLMISFFVPMMLAAYYPSYNIVTGKNDPKAKILMWIKLALISVGLLVLSMIIAFLITEAINADLLKKAA